MTPLLRRGHAFSFVLQICIIVSAAVLGWKNGTEKRSVAGDRSRGPSTHLRVAFFLLEDSDVGFQQSFSGNLEALDVARGLAAENASFAVRVVFVGGPHSSMPLDEAAHNQLGSHNLTTLKLPKERLSEDLGRAGISYERLNYPTLPTETTHHIRQSRSVYRYLKEHAKDIDVAHFVDSGLAYLPLSARRAGLPELQRIGFFHGVFAGSEDYRRLRHGVESDEKGEGLGLKSSTRPSPASTREAPVDATDLQSAYMERKSAEWADSVVFISDSLRRWTTENAGWRFEGSIVTLYGDEQLRCGASDAQKAQTKGLILLFPTWRELFKVTASSFFVPFCSVVATATESNSFSILLGAERSNSIFKESSYTEKSALLRHISAACNGIEVQFSDDFSVAKTLTDLGRADALVVMLYDSKAGSSDLTLAALKRHGVRFVVLPVSADGRELADLALETINKKRFETAHIPRTSSEIMTLYGFAQLHRQELDSHSPSSFPSVSVIITVYERFTYLRQALSSLLAQDFAGQMEIIVVDDGSQSDGAAGNLSAIINSLANEATQRPGARSLRLLSLSENVYLGRARNEGRKLAIGDVLMFMDDDNVAKPYEVRTFVKALLSSSNTAIFTCLSDSFSGETPPAEPVANPASIEYHFLPFGGSAGSGAFMNSFGDANFVIRSSAFDRIGGFTEDRDLSYEDWEFLARAQLIGFEVGIVPESLFWKRTLGDSMLRSNARDPYRTFMSEWRTIRPFVDTLPLGYGERLQLARRAAMQSSGSGIETPLIASTWEDWVGKQGNRGWTFGHRTRTAEGLGPFVPFGQKENTEKGVELYADPPLPRWLHVARGKQHGAITGSGAHVVVRRWASNTLARAEVKLSAVRPDHKMNCGDGSKISIDLIGKSDRGHSLAERILGPKDKEGVLMTEIDVKPDTVLEFRQDPLSDAECDELWLRATVSAA